MAVRVSAALWLLCALLSACGAHVFHRVQPGETLYAVSFRYGHDYREVAKWNNLTAPYTIHAGMMLRVVPHASRSAGASAIVERSTSAPIVDRVPVHTSDSLARNVPLPAAPPVSPPVAPPAESASPVVRAPVVKSPRVATAPPVQAAAPLVWVWPAKSGAINASSRGIDILGRMGDPVYAAAGGRVVYAGAGLNHYGNLLIIKHSDALLSAYAHNRALHVTEGQLVAAGQHIADMGSRNDGEVMLHFQIRLNGRPTDPLHRLPRRP